MRKTYALLAAAALTLTSLAFLGASPEVAPPEPVPTPWSTVVRITCDPGNGTLFLGSGTVIISDPERSVILTASHVIDHPGSVSVELFDGVLTPPGSDHPSVSPIARYEGKKLGVARTTDVGLVEIRPGRVLDVSPLVGPDEFPSPGDGAITVGCSKGADPTPWHTRVIHVDASADPSEYRGIECESQPIEGRSGGGLFRASDWALEGVCDFAVPKNGTGLYATPASIHGALNAAYAKGLLSPTQRFRCPPGVNCPPAGRPTPQSEPPFLQGGVAPQPTSPPSAQTPLKLPDLQEISIGWTEFAALGLGAGGVWLAMRKPSGLQGIL
jgi:hypothetical protein